MTHDLYLLELLNEALDLLDEALDEHLQYFGVDEGLPGWPSRAVAILAKCEGDFGIH